MVEFLKKIQRIDFSSIKTLDRKRYKMIFTPLDAQHNYK
jgi:hypothetical protein